jgi:hypothetical protein
VSRTHIPAELRRQVAIRADQLCEYCLLDESDTFFGCEVDHIISEKHGGLTIAENLAYAYLACNRNKGSDIGSILRPNGVLTRFFNPRVDSWFRHFALEGVIIKPLTEAGQVTEFILRFNDLERVIEREALQAVRGYPPARALREE